MTDTTKPAKSIYDAIRPDPWQPPSVAAAEKPEEVDDKPLSIYEQVRNRGPIFHAGTVRNG
jgi:hypothetical protein